MGNEGKRVQVHYVGTYDNGEEFDSSAKHGQPLEFVCGVGMMIPGFDRAVAGMEVGDEIDVHLEPRDAYGEINPDAFQEVPVDTIPNGDQLPVGQTIYMQDGTQFIPARVVKIENGIVTFDFNSQMAGKSLNFHIQLLSAEDPVDLDLSNIPEPGVSYKDAAK